MSPVRPISSTALAGTTHLIQPPDMRPFSGEIKPKRVEILIEQLRIIKMYKEA